MNTKLSTLIVLALMVVIPPVGAASADEVVHTLQAGNDPSWDIGEVKVWNDAANLYVEFVVDDRDGGDWELLKTQVLATTELSKKQKSGAPGQFPYEHTSPDAKSDSFTISLADLGVASGEDLIVAFHANVENRNDSLGYEDIFGVIHDSPGSDLIG